MFSVTLPRLPKEPPGASCPRDEYAIDVDSRGSMYIVYIDFGATKSASRIKPGAIGSGDAVDYSAHSVRGGPQYSTFMYSVYSTCIPQHNAQLIIRKRKDASTPQPSSLGNGTHNRLLSLQTKSENSPMADTRHLIPFAALSMPAQRHSEQSTPTLNSRVMRGA